LWWKRGGNLDLPFQKNQPGRLPSIIQMSWEFGFDDAFFPGSFADASFGGPPFGPEPVFDSTPAFFAPPQAKAPSLPSAARPALHLSRDGQSLANENAELRRTALSLGEKFAQIASINERLKGQLEDCRSKFRSAVCAGFRGNRK
jgi:hypothetical protein